MILFNYVYFLAVLLFKMFQGAHLKTYTKQVFSPMGNQRGI